MGILSEIISGIPIVGQTYGVGKTAVNVYCNATSPVNAVLMAGRGVLIDCTPPQIKYPLKCSLLVGSIASTILSGGNPFVASLAIGQFRAIIMEELT